MLHHLFTMAFNGKMSGGMQTFELKCSFFKQWFVVAFYGYFHFLAPLHITDILLIWKCAGKRIIRLLFAVITCCQIWFILGCLLTWFWFYFLIAYTYQKLHLMNDNGQNENGFVFWNTVVSICLVGLYLNHTSIVAESSTKRFISGRKLEWLTRFTY